MKHLIDQRQIINSKAFRRLSDKTQVIHSKDRDAQVRSRLTHSLEVASIGKEIAMNVRVIKEYEINPECVYNVALLHDYGMCGLGHLGEKTFQDVFYKKTGLVFEANANNLVVIEKNLPDISKLTIVSTIKYPFLFKSESDGSMSKKGIYESQYKKYMPILTDIIDLQNQYPEIERTRTYECDIMELADDIAYLMSDLSDAIQSYSIQISREELKEYFVKAGLVNADLFVKLLDVINNKNFKMLEEIREIMILNIYFDAKTNSFGAKDKDYEKLKFVIRKIDWNLYIKKYALVMDDEIMRDFVWFLNEVVDMVESNPKIVAEKIIISETYRRAFIDAIALKKTTKAYKILLITLSEWTDTTVSNKIRQLKVIKNIHI